MPRDDAGSSIKPIIGNTRRIQITWNFIRILIKQLRYHGKELCGTGFKAFRIWVSCQVDSDLCEMIHTRYERYRETYIEVSYQSYWVQAAGLLGRGQSGHLFRRVFNIMNWISDIYHVSGPIIIMARHLLHEPHSSSHCSLSLTDLNIWQFMRGIFRIVQLTLHVVFIWTLE